MTTFRFILTVALLYTGHSFAEPIPGPLSSFQTLYQFPPSTPQPWLECMAQRSNSDLLITRAHVPEIWTVNTNTGDATLLKAFPKDPTTAETSLAGIVEYDYDQYAVNYLPYRPFPQTPVGGVEGENGIYTIDLRSPWHSTKYFPIPEATWLNGMTVALWKNGRGQDWDVDSEDGTKKPRYPRVLLSAECRFGGIFAVDPYTGRHKFSQLDPSMIPVLPFPKIGIDGIHVLRDQIYYTSNGALYRFRFSLRNLFDDLTLTKIGPVVKIATVLPGGQIVDDFTLKEDGTAYLAAIVANTVYKVSPSGEVTVVASSLNDTSIPGPTDCKFDRNDPRKLYVSTNGGQIAPVNGDYVEPGKIVVLKV